MAQTFDYRDIYNDYMAAKNPDMSRAGDAFGGDKSGYQKYLQSNFQTKYGIDPSQNLNLSAFAPKAPLLDEAGRNGLSRFLGHKGMMDASVVPEEGGAIGQWGTQRELDAAMSALKQFDPHARIEEGMIYYDQSKLPKFKGGDLGGHDPFNAGLTALNTNDAGSRMIDSRAVIHDPNYGDFTSSGNLKQAANDGDGGFMGQLGKYMPGAISSAMGMATGGMFTPGLLNSLISATSGGGMGGLSSMLKNFGMNYAAGMVPGGSTALSAYKLAQLAKSMGR